MNSLLSSGLYIVATPIGNLSDLSARARTILSQVAVVAVEDSRVTGKLLHHLGIKAKMIRYDDHVGDQVRAQLLARMACEPVALVSDAGTPLIADPGYRLVREARELGLMVTTIPGPCAVVAALTLAGLPTDRFMFIGFLPRTKATRSATFNEIKAINSTIICYETAPRLAAALADMAQILGEKREAAIIREITKLHEQCHNGSLQKLAAYYSEHKVKGEIVIVLAPPSAQTPALTEAIEEQLRVALASHPQARAVRQVAKSSGVAKEILTNLAEKWRNKQPFSTD